MQGLIIATLLLLVPLILVISLRTNAAVMFFVICGASTLQTYIDKDVTGFAASLLPGKSVNVVPLMLLVLPLIAVAFAFRHTVAKSMMFFHIILAVLVGATVAFTSTQFLPVGVVSSIQHSFIYLNISAYSSMIIAATFLLSVVVVWLSHLNSITNLAKNTDIRF